MSRPKPEMLLFSAITAALHAGKEILKTYYSDDFTVRIKTDSTQLTTADQRSHEVITDILAQTGLPVLSEEGKNIHYKERQGWDYFWLIDPLDGTKEFIKRNGEFTVNIALVCNRKPVMGVIYIPVLEDLYLASPETGSYKVDCINYKSGKKNLREIISAGTRLPFRGIRTKYTVAASRSHMTPETEEFILSLKKKYGDISFISKGSSLKICMVAEGIADIYPRFAPTMEWDTAAGHAIAEYAGCTVTREDGITPLEYNKENLMNPWFIVKSLSERIT